MFEFSKNSFGRTNFTKHSHHTREFTVGGSRVISIHTHHLQSKCFKSTRHISSRSPNTKLRLLIQQSFAHRCCVKLHKTDQLFVDRTRTHALTCAHTNHKQTEHKQTNHKPRSPRTPSVPICLNPPHPTQSLTHSLTHSLTQFPLLTRLLRFCGFWFGFLKRARVLCRVLPCHCRALPCPVLSPSCRRRHVQTHIALFGLVRLCATPFTPFSRGRLTLPACHGSGGQPTQHCVHATRRRGRVTRMLSTNQGVRKGGAKARRLCVDSFTSQDGRVTATCQQNAGFEVQFWSEAGNRERCGCACEQFKTAFCMVLQVRLKILLLSARSSCRAAHKRRLHARLK